MKKEDNIFFSYLKRTVPILLLQENVDYVTYYNTNLQGICLDKRNLKRSEIIKILMLSVRLTRKKLAKIMWIVKKKKLFVCDSYSNIKLKRVKHV